MLNMTNVGQSAVNISGLGQTAGLDVQGAFSEEDSNGGNAYFGLGAETKQEEKEDGFESSDSSDIIDIRKTFRPKAKQPAPSQETLGKLSTCFLTAFIPFRIPIALQ